MASIRHRIQNGQLRQGFSLIELLIVVGLVGILLAVAIPTIGRTVTRDRVARSAMVVQGMLDEASQLAARRREPVTVTVSGNVLAISDRATATVIRQRTFGQGMDIKADLTFTPSGGITIFPNGRSTAQLTVDLSGGGVSQTVVRTTTGIIRRL